MKIPEYYNLLDSNSNSLNDTQIEFLSQAGWKEWLEDRLQGKDSCFPEPNYRQNETYKSFFIEVISKIHIDKKTIPLMALYEVTKNVLTYPEKYDDDFSASVFFLFRFFWEDFSRSSLSVRESTDALIQMLKNELIYAKYKEQAKKQFDYLKDMVFNAPVSYLSEIMPSGASKQRMG